MHPGWHQEPEQDPGPLQGPHGQGLAAVLPCVVGTTLSTSSRDAHFSESALCGTLGHPARCRWIWSRGRVSVGTDRWSLLANTHLLGTRPGALGPPHTATQALLRGLAAQEPPQM